MILRWVFGRGSPDEYEGESAYSFSRPRSPRPRLVSNTARARRPRDVNAYKWDKRNSHLGHECIHTLGINTQNIYPPAVWMCNMNTDRGIPDRRVPPPRGREFAARSPRVRQEQFLPAWRTARNLTQRFGNKYLGGPERAKGLSEKCISRWIIERPGGGEGYRVNASFLKVAAPYLETALTLIFFYANLLCCSSMHHILKMSKVINCFLLLLLTISITNILHLSRQCCQFKKNLCVTFSFASRLWK